MMLLAPVAGASFLPANARNPLAVRGGAQGGGAAADGEAVPLLGGGGGGQQQQALMAPAADQYLASRAEALHQVESTIVELGGIFQQLAHMVAEQGEMAVRIDENVEDSLANVDAGQQQLLKYLSAISSNRWVGWGWGVGRVGWAARGFGSSGGASCCDVAMLAVCRQGPG